MKATPLRACAIPACQHASVTRMNGRRLCLTHGCEMAGRPWLARKIRRLQRLKESGRGIGRVRVELSTGATGEELIGDSHRPGNLAATASPAHASGALAGEALPAISEEAAGRVSSLGGER